MAPLFTALLILVPAPADAPAPTGPPPKLQYVKYNGGKFESTVTVVVAVPVQETVIVQVNGQQQMQTVTRLVTQHEIQKAKLEADKAMVFTLEGKQVDEKAWQKRLADGAVVLLSTDGNIPDPAYFKVLKEGTLIVVLQPSPNLAPMLPAAPPAPPLPK